MANSSMPEPTTVKGDTPSTFAVYRWTCWLLILLSTAVMIGRILSVIADTGETPMLSANDRSRWCTVRSLVENGTYAIDPIIREKHPETHRRYWSTIDRVRHRGPDGKEHDYSSKPPLLPTLLAGEYWLVRALTGATLAHDPFFVMRWMLVLTNVVPLIIYFVVLMHLIEQLAQTTMARLYIMAAATFGTFITTYAVTLNNHIPAAIATLLTISLLWRIYRTEQHRWGQFFAAGLCGAFVVACELPALSMLAIVTAALLWRAPKMTLLGFAPGVLIIAAAFFGTNYAAHGYWTPAYAHRKDGATMARIDRAIGPALDKKQLPPELRSGLAEHNVKLSDQALLIVDVPGKRWEIWDRVGARRFALVDNGTEIEIRRWGNWYDYAGSYWRNKRGVDRGEVSRARYAEHVIIGHHGLLSLTPVWFLAILGCVMLVRDARSGWRQFAVMVAVLTLVCLAFYIARPVGDRNYGGVTSGFRWMFWFAPLWLLCCAPAADALLATPRGRWLAAVLLMISVMSATYSSANPWTHPWLFDYGTYMGWWHY